MSAKQVDYLKTTRRRESMLKPTIIAVELVREWRDHAFANDDIAIGELVRRIASAIADYSKR